MKKSAFIPYFFVVMLSTSCAQKSDSDIKTPKSIDFTIEKVVEGIQNPWGMAFLPNSGILITEKVGKILSFKEGELTEIENLPKIYVRGQGGLMDIELHPNYIDNGWLYLSFASSEGNGKGGNTAIMRARLSNNQLVDKQLLYKGEPNTTKGQHFGSRLEFDNEGYLYFSIGDRGNRDVNPQDLTRDGGKIYRIHDDGRIPDDNPFIGKPKNKSAVFSYGHRNPQGLAKHPLTGQIWEHEHGPRGGDEINKIQKGKKLWLAYNNLWH